MSALALLSLKMSPFLLKGVMPAVSCLLICRQWLFVASSAVIFHQFLVGLLIYLSGLFLDGLKSCPVLDLVGGSCTSPGSVFVPRLSFQFVIDPRLVPFR